jgi:Zn-dependent peptidase ImmA (M78 family)
MKELDIKILGQDWYVTCITEHEYKSIYADAEEAEAFMDPSLSTITINDAYLTLDTVTHELVHAYIETCGVSHPLIEKDSFEEIMCTIFAKYGREIIKQADSIYHKLKGKG